LNILDILTKGAGIPADTVRRLILAGAKAVPDLADEAQALIDKLDATLTSEKLIALGAEIMTEANDIAHGKIDPRDHPSDAA